MRGLHCSKEWTLVPAFLFSTRGSARPAAAAAVSISSLSHSIHLSSDSSQDLTPTVRFSNSFTTEPSAANSKHASIFHRLPLVAAFGP